MNAKTQNLIKRALKAMEESAKYGEIVFTSAAQAQAWAMLRVGMAESEEFHVAYLDSQNGLIEAVKMFQGTINQAHVYPREIVKTGLLLNAAAIILVHNHPSGLCEPSSADRNITRQIADACSLVDIIVLDNLIVTKKQCYSFVEHGLI